MCLEGVGIIDYFKGENDIDFMNVEIIDKYCKQINK